MRLRTLAACSAVALLGILPAHAGTEVRFACGGSASDPAVIESMENEYIEATGFGPCWFHTGHHTYDAGRAYAVGAVSGSLFTVEAELSPPTEPHPGLGWQPSASIAFETSLDGLAWETLAQIPYPLFKLESGQELFRHPVAFSFHGGGAVARYFRIRQPISSAAGLSGYLDSSGFTAMLTPAEATAPRTAPDRLSCVGDIMERFFARHPCTFGGVNRYDSPSVFHTYPIGDRTLGRVGGHVVFLPWRTDDYHQNSSRTAIAGVLQSSADGVNWTTVLPLSGTFGAPISFDAVLAAPVRASYLRFVAEVHPGAFGRSRHPALKHVRGFIADSALSIG